MFDVIGEFEELRDMVLRAKDEGKELSEMALENVR